MSLSDKIDQDIKKAMLARESKKLEALRAIKAELLLAGTEKKAAGKISGQTEMQILQKLVKQRKESAGLYREKGREDLAATEEFQSDVIGKYLPEQLGEGEIKTILADIIKETGASGIKDMGKVMGMATKKLSGKADNKTIADLAKQMLG